MKNKPRFAMYWASACGGCEIAVLNINEKILDIDSNFEIVFWPAIMDIKYCDVEKFDDQSIFITLFNGSIRNEENEEMARLLRRKSQILVAFGSCAVEGCIPGLANLFCVQEILDTTFHTISTDSHEISLNTNYSAPEGLLSLPLLNTRISTLSQVVNVDYFIPGCPPESQQISTIIDLLIKVVHGEAQLPPKGSIIGAGPSTVCDECPRKKNLKLVKKFFRIHEIDHLAPEVCILEQGVPCNGPATRSGCNARCPSIGAQCIGCYGPAEDVADCGARLISAFASIIDSNDPKEIENILGGIPDPVGQFYRFHLANSILRTGMKNWQPLGSKEKEDDNKPN